MPARGELLIDDERGRICYVRDLIAPEAARNAFETLRREVPWRSERREMYGRDVDVPRLLASYRLERSDVPEPIRDALNALRAIEPAPFDSVGLNLYRDGSDSVAPHNDHLYEIARDEPIALVSFGATRTLLISAKQGPAKMRVDLEPGSLLVMSYATQLHFNHGIPKVRTPVGPRISLAFRVRGKAARRYD
jgi:alkylated DNA repair dioxygenase AlkB